MTATKQLGFIGARGHWDQVLRQLASVPTLRLTALSDGGDTVAPVAQWCRDNGHEPRFFDDYRTMLSKSGIDMVVICGPFELHAAMCIEAIERGIHVLTEKPAALTFAELERLRKACENHPEVHLAGMMFSRYAPGFYTARELIQTGAVGDIRLINARKSYKLGRRPAYYHQRETYGGTIPWVGSHAIDWVMWLSGGAFESVYAMHSASCNNGNGAMERSALCQFELTGGRAASISIDVFRPDNAPTHGDDWCRVVGSEGVMEIRQDSIRLINPTHKGSEEVAVRSDRHLLGDFVERIAGGSNNQSQSAAMIDATSTLALTEACLKARQSADEMRVVRF